MYLLFVTSFWAALYNFMSGLAKPFRLEAEEHKITWGHYTFVSCAHNFDLYVHQFNFLKERFGSPYRGGEHFQIF